MPITENEEEEEEDIGESFSLTQKFSMRIPLTPVTETLLLGKRGIPLKPEGLVVVAKTE